MRAAEASRVGFMPGNPSVRTKGICLSAACPGVGFSMSREGIALAGWVKPGTAPLGRDICQQHAAVGPALQSMLLGPCQGVMEDWRQPERLVEGAQRRSTSTPLPRGDGFWLRPETVAVPIGEHLDRRVPWILFRKPPEHDSVGPEGDPARGRRCARARARTSQRPPRCPGGTDRATEEGRRRLDLVPDRGAVGPRFRRVSSCLRLTTI